MDSWLQTSAVVAEHAAISSDQPIANDVGIDILKKGGNAADAAVATMAVISILEPNACGIGGDCQCLFYRASDKKIYAINGSGRSGRNATLEKVQSVGIVDTTQKEFYNHGLWVSVPGTVTGMYSIIEKFGSGKLTMDQILSPAIRLAEKGVPIPHKSALLWENYKHRIANSKQADDLLNNGQAPRPGEKLYAKKLAQSFKLTASQGVEGFYSGKMAENIVKEVQIAGGVLTLEDMKEHLVNNAANEIEEAVSIDFHGFRVWEMKPNTIGIVALVALNILKLYDLKSLGHNSAEYIHVVSEAIKHAYVKCWNYLCDPAYNSPCFKSLLSEDYSIRLKRQIDNNNTCSGHNLITGGNTCYVAAIDQEGNGCSFICSVSSDFGASLIPEDCGFVLHDRLKCMSLDENSPNVYGPNKLPLHTIIPAVVTDAKTNELVAVLGICGRWMQPQGKIQLLLNMIVFGMDPQTALSEARFFVGDYKTMNHYNESLSMITLEKGIPPSVVPILKQKGHEVIDSVEGLDRTLFGKGSIIAQPVLWDRSATILQKSWWAGADPRTDGSATGF